MPYSRAGLRFRRPPDILLTDTTSPGAAIGRRRIDSLYRRRGASPFAQHISHTCVVDGTPVVLSSGPVPDVLRRRAGLHGFEVVSRTAHKDWLLIRCLHCSGISRRRWSVVRDHRPECHQCILNRRVAAARKIGVSLIGADPDHRHYGLFQLGCGHIVRRQYLRVERAAAGGHALGCETCREARYSREAEAQGWTLVVQGTSGRQGYRSYRHRCGHFQNASVGNMANGDIDCAGCGQSWSAKPSMIYLFRIGLPSGTVLKLGYSSNPWQRLRRQLGIAPGTPTKILRLARMPTGHAACREETTAHTWMRHTHTELVVPKAVYGDSINTRSEIYAPDAEPILRALLDRIADRFPEADAPPD